MNLKLIEYGIITKENREKKSVGAVSNLYVVCVKTTDEDDEVAENTTDSIPDVSLSVCHKNEVGYGESISLESYVPAKYEYTFKGWFTVPRTKQNQVTTFKFAKPDILYAKWESNPRESINPNNEIKTHLFYDIIFHMIRKDFFTKI